MKPRPPRRNVISCEIEMLESRQMLSAASTSTPAAAYLVNIPVTTDLLVITNIPLTLNATSGDTKSSSQTFTIKNTSLEPITFSITPGTNNDKRSALVIDNTKGQSISGKPETLEPGKSLNVEVYAKRGGNGFDKTIIGNINITPSDPNTLSPVQVGYTVNVSTVNIPPVLTAGAQNSTPPYTSGAPTAIAPNLTLQDTAKGAKITGATVTISANYASGEDVLAYPAQIGKITVKSNNGGTLTLTGPGTAAQYQQALASITYQDTNPNPSQSNRTFTFTATASTGATSAPVDQYVSISSLMSGVGTATQLSYGSGDPEINVLPNTFSLAQTATGNITGATIQISTNFDAAYDQLLFTNANGITGSYANGTLTLSGTASVADYEAALLSVTFYTFSTSTLQRQISITVDGATNPQYAAYRYINVS